MQTQTPTDSSPQFGQRYDTTRIAWENIWAQDSDIASEIEIARSRRARHTMDFYRQFLDPDSLILEAGSGLSAVIITLRRMGYHVIGLDYAVGALQASHAYDASLQLAAGDVHQLPFADNSLGGYLSFGVLEHFEHGMQPALREAWRVLKPGGTMVLTIPYPGLIWRLAQLRRQMQGRQLIDDDFYESTCTRQQLLHNVTAVGFDVVEAVPTSHSFALWGLGGPFRAPGYYRTSWLAEALGFVLLQTLPWTFNYMTCVIARK